MIRTKTDYDLIAIGSGPAGQRAAVQAAKLGKRAAVVERADVLGGASTNSGTVPSKALRAVILELSCQTHRAFRQHVPKPTPIRHCLDEVEDGVIIPKVQITTAALTG